MPKTLVSIIIPAWNTSDTIRRMASSVLAQSFEDYELILIDDGSTDDTLSVLQAIEKSDKRVRVFTKANGGPSSARNLGLEKARGTYIQFYDSDDNIDVDALQCVTDAITANKSDVVVSGWQIDLPSTGGIVRGYKHISPLRQIIDNEIPTSIIRSLGQDGTLYNLWNKLFRTDIIKNNNLRFREDLRFGEDLIFSMQYLDHVKRLDIIPDITYRYLTNSSTSVFASSSLIPEYREINDLELVKFAGKNPTAERYDLMQWLRWRWLMSYWSLVSSSKKGFSEKLSLIRQFSPSNLTVAKSHEYIGFKNIFLEIVARVAKISPLTSLLLGWILSSIKKLVLKLKLVIKR